MLHRVNPFVQFFVQVGQTIRQDPNILRFCILFGRAEHGQERVQNAPSVNEVAGILVNYGDSNDTPSANIVLEYRRDTQNSQNPQQQLEFISYLDPCWPALLYPLLFPCGDLWWHPDMTIAGNSVPVEVEVDTGNQNRRLSLRQYTAYRLFKRPHDGNSLLMGGKLLLQFLVDTWVAIEDNCLMYQQLNQTKLRAELYQGAADALGQQDLDVNQIGRRIVLPSSFTGGARHMVQQYQDAMALVRRFGRPDLFITFTYNPTWTEISRHLAPCGEASFDPAVVCRVFCLKLRALMDLIVKTQAYGPVLSYVYTIEFQKRGLPHAHILITLAEGFKPITPSDVDCMVHAHLPNPNTEGRLFDIVVSNMVHVCHKDKCGGDGVSSMTCSKHYPRPFQAETYVCPTGFPQYARPQNGPVHHVPNQDWLITSQHEVPYNPLLLLLFLAHVNVEVVGSLQTHKYIFKYITKGPDYARVTLQLEQTGEGVQPDKAVNEIEQYVTGRYVSSMEAAWRILGFPIHKRSHTVVRLPVHLENHHQVVLNSNQGNAEALEAIQGNSSMLMAWFELNLSNDGLSHSLRYIGILEHYTWQITQKVWCRRRNSVIGVGRLCYVPPSAGEVFYLRLLLNHACGATSFASLRTINGHECSDYRSACLRLGILEDDLEYIEAMEEAVMFQMPAQLRQLFATLLLFALLSDPLALWNRFQESMIEDFVYRDRILPSNDMCFHLDEALSDIDQILRGHGKSLSNFPMLPQVSSAFQTLQQQPGNLFMAREHSYNLEELQQSVQNAQLNPGQQYAFNDILGAVNSGIGKVFFIDGPGGTGKTFLYKIILAPVRSNLDHNGLRSVALAVASSGIAATLLPGGRTAHSMFKIPLALGPDSLCGLSKQSHLAEVIQAAKIIVWDECSMAHRHAMESVNRLLQDLMDDHTQPFGGKVFVFGGYFCQILPVIQGGTSGDTIRACLKYSNLWQNVCTLRLTQNMRAQDYHAYATWLLSVGNGLHTQAAVQNCVNTGAKKLAIPHHMQLPEDSTLNDLIDFVYPPIAEDQPVHNYQNCCILAPYLENVHAINSKMVESVPGVVHTYLSADLVMYEEGEQGPDASIMIPTEVLNTICPSGFPTHSLKLKPGVPIIMLQNLDPSRGLCNGTRMVVVQCLRRVILARIIGGQHNGSQVVIPRIDLITGEGERLPYQIRRLQFPVCLAFALTINKAQGQTLEQVGVYLPRPVFTHGQLYIVFSRCGNPNGIRVLVAGNSKITGNVEYQEVL